MHPRAALHPNFFFYEYRHLLSRSGWLWDLTQEACREETCIAPNLLLYMVIFPNRHSSLSDLLYHNSSLALNTRIDPQGHPYDPYLGE